MLTVHALKKSYHLQVLFENVSFTLNAGDRLGLVGANGCGKTTLLRILMGLESADEGHVGHDARLRIGYLPQGFAFNPDDRVSDVIGRAVGNLDGVEAELVETAAALALDVNNAGLQSRYDDLLRRLEFAETGRAAEILAGLGLDQVDPNLAVGLLSGGQKTRLSLALVLLGDPQILLLDEPTNHLDISMLEWLEDWIQASPCGVLMVSHDRTFLDHTVTRILEMDPRHTGIKEFIGNYSDYLEQRQAEFDKQLAAYSDQQMEIRRMQQDIVRAKAQAAYTERQASSIRIGGPEMKIKGRKAYHQSIAKKVAKKAAAREKKLDRYVESDERIERPRESWQIQINFQDTPHLGRAVMVAEELAVGYRSEAPLLQDLDLSVQSGQRVAITGPNGCGKTTLLRTLAGELAPLAGKVWVGSSVRIGYMSQDQSTLNPKQTVLETVLPEFPNQTEARRFLASFLFHGDEVLKPVAQISYGQRSRLMLALLVAQKHNCLLLDEPINYLDIPSRTQFEQALAQFDGAVLAVVHDRYFIDRFADEVWWVEDGDVQVDVLRGVGE